MIRRLVALFSVGCVVFISGLLAYASARPLFTDDTWWHLAHGEAYRANGPWLQTDPLLFSAPGPPLPASWLFDLGLYEILQTSGFAGLRIFHALAVVAILWLAFHLLRRISASTEFAALGTSAFAVLSAFRLFQLRPELFTIGATLALYALLVRPLPDNRRNSRAQVGIIAFALGGIWANLHAGFVLAPILLGAATAGMVAALLVFPKPASQFGGASRACDLLIACVASFVGSLCNPSGYAAYTPYLRAGVSTPSLTSVYDEWAPLRLFSLPLRDISPAPTDWVLLWILLIATVAGLILFVSFARAAKSRTHAIDPALVALACASWVACFVAVRFIWLAIFPILLLGQHMSVYARSPSRSPLRINAIFALSTALLIPAFLSQGMWSFVSRGIPKTLRGYSEPYAIGKHPGHAAWFMARTGLTGNVYAPYPSGGFLGFWLSPKLRVLANGSLNLDRETMEAYSALQQRQGQADSSFEATLIENDIDLFLGSGLPGYHPTRRRPFTTTHPEHATGWVPVFRTPRSSIWLRDHPGNSKNFDRIEGYYAKLGISFDRQQGFEVSEALRVAPAWSRRNGIAAKDLAALEYATSAKGGQGVPRALDRLAQLRASLGQYERALELDARLEMLRPNDARRLRRQVWCLLHLDRGPEALRRSLQISESSGDRLDAHFRAAAKRYSEESDPSQRAAIAATLPFLSREEAGHLMRGFSRPAMNLPTANFRGSP